MTIMVEEQQKRSERARIKAYYARRRRKRLQKTLKQKPSGFKDMRLTNTRRKGLAALGQVATLRQLRSGCW